MDLLEQNITHDKFGRLNMTELNADTIYEYKYERSQMWLGLPHKKSEMEFHIKEVDT